MTTFRELEIGAFFKWDEKNSLFPGLTLEHNPLLQKIAFGQVREINYPFRFWHDVRDRLEKPVVQYNLHLVEKD